MQSRYVRRVPPARIVVLFLEALLISLLYLLLEPRLQSTPNILAPVIVFSIASAYYGYERSSVPTIFGANVLIIAGIQNARGAITNLGGGPLQLSDYLIYLTIFLIVATALTVPAYLVGWFLRALRSRYADRAA